MKTKLFRSLQQKGMASFRIPKDRAELFENTLNTFSESKTFRFPPQEGAVPYDQWPSNYRECYSSLEAIARQCYFSLLSELSEMKVVNPGISFKDDISFDTSFMNMFNYKYGYLKPHRDRCLVTIIYRQYSVAAVGKEIITHTDESNPNTKILWSHDVDFTPTENRAHWNNVDTALCTEENQVCLFIGEEMSALCGNHLTANEHCVTENPNLPYIAHSENSSDRMSMAFVLSSPNISAYIESNSNSSIVSSS